MQISPETCPQWKPRRQHSYAEIFKTLIKCGTSLCIEGHEVTGLSKQAKQTALHQAAEIRGYKIDTQSAGDQIYIRLRPEGGL